MGDSTAKSISSVKDMDCMSSGKKSLTTAVDKKVEGVSIF